MSVSPTKNSSILSNARTYIIPVLIVMAGIMIAMGNVFASHADTLPPQTHITTSIPVVYHSSGAASGGTLK
jgi:hypothetical protein